MKIWKLWLCLAIFVTVLNFIALVIVIGPGDLLVDKTSFKYGSNSEDVHYSNWEEIEEVSVEDEGDEFEVDNKYEKKHDTLTFAATLSSRAGSKIAKAKEELVALKLRDIMNTGPKEVSSLKAKLLKDSFGSRIDAYNTVYGATKRYLDIASVQANMHWNSGSGSKGGGNGGSVNSPSMGPIKTNKKQKPIQCSQVGDIDVVYSSNSFEYAAMLASASSALHNTLEPDRLVFHFVIPHTSDADELCTMLQVYAHAFPDVICPASTSPTRGSTVRACASSYGGYVQGKGRTPCMCGMQFHILQFNPSDYPIMEHIRRSSKDRKELLSVMNFARNFIDDLLLPTGVQKIIYMDVDTIVQGDLRNLWSVKFKPKHFFGPAHTCNQPWSFWFNFKSWVIFNSHLKEEGCAVNAGVYILDVKQYAEHRVQQRIAELIVIHEKRLESKMKGVWRRGVHQPSFVLALYNYTQRVDAKWNMGQLGWDEHLAMDELRQGYILHWNGQQKPWNNDGLYRQFWLPYALPLPAPQNAMLFGNCLYTTEQSD